MSTERHLNHVESDSDPLMGKPIMENNHLDELKESNGELETKLQQQEPFSMVPFAELSPVANGEEEKDSSSPESNTKTGGGPAGGDTMVTSEDIASTPGPRVHDPTITQPLLQQPSEDQVPSSSAEEPATNHSEQATTPPLDTPLSESTDAAMPPTTEASSAKVEAVANAKKKQDESVMDHAPVQEDDDEQPQGLLLSSTVAGASTTTSMGATKKISAKELVQHVKNQKKKIQEKEAEVEVLKSVLTSARMRALSSMIDLVTKSRGDKLKLRAFHRWLAFAEREAAAVEVERVAGLAHRASSELETIKSQLESLKKEKVEQETAQKKLRVLLAKAKQQMAEQSRAHEQLPDAFTPDDVLRKTRGPDGKIWCLVLLKSRPGTKPSSAGAATEEAPGTPGAAATAVRHSYEWREESFILSWLSQHPTLPVGTEKQLQEKPTIEDELQERYSRATLELESALAEKQLQLDAANDRFEQFRRRAELALEKAESSHHVHDAESEQALKEELSRVCRDRDAMATKLEELKSKLDTAESTLSALRLREKGLREERDDLERRVQESSRALEVSRSAWEQTLAQAELDHETRIRTERNEIRALEERLEHVEKQLAQSLQREIELKESEKIAQNKMARADDRIEALQAAVSRAEAKANSAEISRHLALNSSSSSQPLPMQQHLQQQQQRVNSQSGLSSMLSSPRGTLARYQSAASASHPTHHQHSSSIAGDEGDSASVVMMMVNESHHAGGGHSLSTRPRKDSESSDLSFSGGGMNHTSSSEIMGSRYFVDQLGAIRAAHRNERTEWQRERMALKQQIEDAIKRKEAAEEKLGGVEKQVVELNLAMERQKQLGESARTVGETPDGLLYLKNAIFRFITADDDSERETLLPVITMLLKFSPEEVQVLSRETIKESGSGSAGGSGLIGGLLSRWTS